MRLSHLLLKCATLVGAMGLCYGAAHLTANIIETTTQNALSERLQQEGMEWASVETYGLWVYLDGTAPSETERLRAGSVAGAVVDSSRIINQLLVEDAAQIAPPDFMVEILRSDSGISLIGLVPPDTDRKKLIDDITQATGGVTVTDLLETADYPYPDSWEAALNYGISIIKSLPQTKISVNASRVAVTAMADSPEDKDRIERDLSRQAPNDIKLALDITAPRPVITPFTLRFLIEGDISRFDACSADDEAARTMILQAAENAGLPDGNEDCIIGLGVPSPKWGNAAALSIKALHDLGGGSLTMSDADISIVAEGGTPQQQFDDVIGRLEHSLPEVFSLHAELPPSEDDTQPPPEFIATLSPEGLVQIRGQVDSEATRNSAQGIAMARFASDTVHSSARITENLPNGWAVRVLTVMEILPILSSGSVVASPEDVKVVGQTGYKDARAKISRLLTEKLGSTEHFDIEIEYKEELDRTSGGPTPEACQTLLSASQETAKITFEPGLTDVTADSIPVLDKIASILDECGQIRMEIAGHTDSQGGEDMNQQLSQARARAVLSELMKRNILTSSFTAKGYGESEPIADNKTEVGREANRRIEFRVSIPENLKNRSNRRAGTETEEVEPKAGNAD